MSIEATAPLIQEVNRAISGVEWAPDPEDYPDGDLDSGMPVILVYEGEGMTAGKENFAAAERNYILECWYANRMSGGNYGSMKLAVSQLLDDVIEAWLARINDDEDHILDWGMVVTDEQSSTTGYRVEMDLSKPIIDSGVREDLEWMPEQFYWGFHVILPMLVRWGSGVVG
jgi:hypothetical protein